MAGYPGGRLKIRMYGGLPYVTVTLRHREREISLPDVLLDTGSTGSVFSADWAAEIGLGPEPMDILHRIRGVGGAEFVFSKRIDALGVGDTAVENFEIQLGTMDYGFPLQGILGTDFLLHTRAVVDMGQGELRF